jgi:hypothetical protein
MPLEVDNWDPANPDSITLISGTDVDEGMLPGLLNNALRRIASAVAALRGQAYCKDKHVTIQASGGALPATPAEGDLFIEF